MIGDDLPDGGAGQFALTVEAILARAALRGHHRSAG